ncbi:MAG TPA: NAD(P)H-dependent oxidoreductase [Alphaproteobacteria bacterium]|nr:NAD(P)H-dependent oxidoreductase [Alphaproteobacteria bacterium]
MQHLLIVSHPQRRSFTQSVAQTYRGALEALGHETVVRDLYRLGFDPVLGEGELPGAKKPVLPAAVRREQRHLAAAGALALFFPLWWAFMPAMTKGYIDRVLSLGFAYGFDGDDLIPLLTGKKALVFTSSAADMAYLRRSKQWQAMRVLERDHILALCGIELLEHVHFPSITPDLSRRSVDRHLERVRRAVEDHWGTAPAPRG